MYADSHNAKIHHKASPEWMGELYWNRNKLNRQIVFWKESIDKVIYHGVIKLPKLRQSLQVI